MIGSLWLILDDASQEVVFSHRTPPAPDQVPVGCSVSVYVPASCLPRWRSVKDDPPQEKFKLVLVRTRRGHRHTQMPAMFSESDVEWMPIPGE